MPVCKDAPRQRADFSLRGVESFMMMPVGSVPVHRHGDGALAARVRVYY